MTELSDAVIAKTMELEDELKNAGLWQKEMPGWVHGYNNDRINSARDFAEWLQFVFIPNHLHKNITAPMVDKNMMVLHAIKYFGADVRKGKLLQVMIELDSLI